MKFFAILCFLLILMIGTRLAGIYTSPKDVLGWDFVNYAVTPWYQILHGQTPIVFGWSSVLLAAAGLRYQSMVAVSILGLLVLLFLFIQQKDTRILALLFFGIFLLGVPMNKAIEAGNPDMFLSVLFGIILLLLQKRTLIRSLALGILLGFFLNVKGFLLLFTLAALALSGPDIPLIVSFLISFAGFALWPSLYGIKTGVFDVFFFALRGSQWESQTIFTQIHYGNNALVSYVSNILQAVAAPQILIYAGSAVLAAFIFIKPFFDEKIFPSIALIRQSYLLVFSFCYVAMLTLTAWSYDYRILYAVPLLFCFLGKTRDRHTTRLLYLSILFLLTKSLFIPKDRIMTLFLYLHFYFLLRAAISLLYNEIHETHRHHPASGAFRSGQNRHII